MSIRRISHIGIAVRSLDEQIPFYRDVLGLPLVLQEVVADQGVRVAMFQVGEVRLELLEPLSEEGPVAKFIQKRGQGMHHLAYEAEELGPFIDHLRHHQAEMIDQAPRPGAHGSMVAFVHPKSSFGVLTELCTAGSSADDA